MRAVLLMGLVLLSGPVLATPHKAVLRQLIQVGTDIVDSGFQPDGRPSTELLASAEKSVFAIAEQGAKGRTDFVAMPGALKDAFEELRNRFENGGNITGLPTGYTDFDNMTGFSRHTCKNDSQNLIYFCKS